MSCWQLVSGSGEDVSGGLGVRTSLVTLCDFQGRQVRREREREWVNGFIIDVYHGNRIAAADLLRF